LLTGNSFEDQDNREQRNYDYRAKNNDLGQRNKRPNDKVQRNNEMELQIEAPIKEMAVEEEEQCEKTDELIVSAFGFRERDLFLFIKKDQRLEQQQGILSRSRSICDLNKEGNVKGPNKFIFG